MGKDATTIALEEGEYALVIGQDGTRMSVRIEGAEDVGSETEDLPVPAVLVAALAERLLEDPEFHDEMLDWYEEHVNEADDDDDEGGDEEDGEEDEEGDGKGVASRA